MDNHYEGPEVREVPKVPEVPATKNNTLGIVSLVLGILGILLSCGACTGIPFGLGALICGIIAKQQNQDFATAGIVLGAISLVISIILTVISIFIIQMWPYLFLPEFMEEYYEGFSQGLY